MEAEIEFDESAIIEGVLSEIDSGMIEASILSHLENTNFLEFIDTDDLISEGKVHEFIEEFMSNMDLSDYIDVNDYIDTCDIRYEIEDDILEQVNDHIDFDTIKYNIEDDITESVFSGFDISDYVDYDDIKNNCEIYELEDRVTVLETQVEELEEIVAQLELVLAENPPRKSGLIRRILGWLW
tara:strand:+ start:2204 stop:2752 length:549 start_codon:yes stop_codon:yes gene_type:complete